MATKNCSKYNFLSPYHFMSALSAQIGLRPIYWQNSRQSVIYQNSKRRFNTFNSPGPIAHAAILRLIIQLQSQAVFQLLDKRILLDDLLELLPLVQRFFLRFTGINSFYDDHRKGDGL